MRKSVEKIFRLAKSALILSIILGAMVFSSGSSMAAIDCVPDPAQPLKCFCEETRDNSVYTDAEGSGGSKSVCQLNDVDADKDSKEGLLSENGIVKKILNLLSWITGLLAAVYLIIGGAKIITSGGNSDSVKSGRRMIIYALIGIVVVISSNLIINFVIGLVNNASK